MITWSTAFLIVALVCALCSAFSVKLPSNKEPRYEPKWISWVIVFVIASFLVPRLQVNAQTIRRIREGVAKWLVETLDQPKPRNRRKREQHEAYRAKIERTPAREKDRRREPGRPK